MGSTCSECAAQLDQNKKLEVGEIFGCTDCGARLEVMGLEPLKVQPAPTVEEDWGE